jgi:putative endonuclease
LVSIWLGLPGSTNSHPEFIFRIYDDLSRLNLPPMSNRYFVYILANRGKMLYTGVTRDLFQRVWQHRRGCGSSFTSKYRTHELVWFEETDDISAAIAREKQIKTWRRQWKKNLVEFENPGWLDLADGWYE